MSNITGMPQVPLLPSYTLRPVPPLMPPISDLHLSLMVPIVVHWVLSGIFSWLEATGCLQQYRLHTSAEELTQNRCSRWQCFRGVVMNQIIQTLLGISLGMLGDGDVTGKEDYDIAVWATRVQAAHGMLPAVHRFIPSLLAALGIDAKGLATKLAGSGMNIAALLVGGGNLDKSGSIVVMGRQSGSTELSIGWEMMVAKIIYWYLVPAFQFAVALLVADTWQYFGHRWEHTNKFIYRHVHAVHHTLYVPYSYGAAFTHPLEGLFLDSVSTAIAFGVSGLTIRQGMCLYGYISFKAVTDHCGYVFPWNPLLLITENDALFHDLHHQKWGLKSHFGVHFGFWDRVMGTRWADKDAAAALYERNRISAQFQLDMKQSRVDESSPSNANGTA